MPASQSPIGSKKPRKKPKAPQVIDEATWRAVQMAICAGGLGYSEVGRRYNIEPHAIMAKARRNAWPVPSMIAKRAETLHRGRSRAHEEARNGNEEVIQTVAESWSERGEAHRALAFQIATSELKKIAKAPPAVESWRDVDVLDRIGRRNAGLDDSERNQTINVGMQLIEYRLSQISLPPDALQSPNLSRR
jgi:hypothetical protein